MAKTLNELSNDLKEYIYNAQNTAHTSSGFKVYRYNNLKLEVMDPRTTKIPQIKVTIGMSEAIFSLITFEKLTGGLGPDEKYTVQWFMRDNVVRELNDAWKRAEKQIGKATGAN